VEQEKNIVNEILYLLKNTDRPLNISEIAIALNHGRHTIARHLDTLLLTGKVSMRQHGQKKKFYPRDNSHSDSITTFSPFIQIILKENYTIEWVDKQFANILGMTRELLVGKLIDSIQTDVFNIESITNHIKRISKGQSVIFEEIINYQGEEYFFEFVLVFFPIGKGEPYLILTGKDITKRTRLEQEIKKSEERFRALINNIPGIVFRLNVQTKSYVQFNELFHTLTGYTPEILIPGLFSPIESIILDEDLEQMTSGYQHAISHKTKYEIEYRIKNIKGEIIYFQECGSPTYNDKGVVEFIDGVILDVTSRKNWENELWESEERNRSLIESIPDLLFHISADGKILDSQFNRKELLLLSPEQFLGKKVEETLPNYLSALTRIKIKETLESRKLQMYEYSLTLEGELFYFETRMIPYKGNTVMAIVRDITPKKNLELALLESEAKYRSIFNNAVMGIYRVREGRFLSANTHAAQILGYSSAEELIESITDIDTQIYADPKARQISKLILLKDGILENFETPCLHKDGSIVWVSFNARLVRDAEGNILYHEGTSHDINERKRAEEKIMIREREFMELVEFSVIGICKIAANGDIISANDTAAHILGYSSSEEFIQSIKDVSTQLYANPEQRIDLLRKIEENDTIQNYKIPSRHKDGSVVSCSIDMKVIRDNKGNVLHKLAYIKDITEQELAEQQLKESEEKYHSLYQNANLGIFHSNFDGKLTDVNPALAKMFGYNSPEEMITSITNISQQIYYEAPEYDVVATSVLNNGGSIEIENRYRRKDGTLLHGKLHLRIVPDNQGKPSHYEGFVEDVTESRLSEEALRKSEEKYRTLANYTYDWEFWITPDGNYNYVSPSCERITGYSPLEFILDPDLLIKITHKDDRDKIVCHLSSKEVNNIEHSALEFRIITKNGEERWISHVCQPIYNTNGEYCGNRGSNRDITGRKRAEEVLQESEEKLNAMLESIADHMSMMDKDLNIIWANETAKRYFGKDLVGRKCYEAFHQRQNPCEPCITLMAFQDGEIHRHETSVIDIHGQRKFFECSANVALKDENCKPIGVLEISRDITENKQGGELLRQANKKLSLLSGITRHDINNKLMVMNGLLNLMENEQLDPILNEYLDKLSTTANRISDMIKFTKEYEQIGINAPSWQECHKIVDNAAKQVLLGEVMVENDLPFNVEVFADILIEKVFYNLIDNAVFHGGKITTIRFSIQESGDSQLIICEDDGEGVPAEDKEEIFERGFGKNSGFGLTLVREILDITSITIRENGEPGKGARFEITVPNGKWRYGSEES